MKKDRMHHNHPKTLHHARELRKAQTSTETKLWAILRNKQLGKFNFRRQHPIGNFIVDFYCSKTKLVIEIDGDSHAEQIAYAAKRTKWIEEQGYTVIRFTNDEVYSNLENVALEILRQCESRRDIG